MRHLVKGKKLGRTASHRKATLSALAIALIEERRIITTVAKAKELRRFVEPLITRAKVDTTHNRRQVFSKLNDKYAVTELFEEVGPLAKDRPGGYTRVLKTGFRQGDGAAMAMIELVDYNDTPPEVIKDKKKRTRRAGKSKKTTPATEPVEKQKDQEKKEDVQKIEGKTEETETVQQEQAVVDEKTTPAETPETAEETKSKTESEEQKQPEIKKTETSTDFNVDEVKDKMKSMSIDEAKAFVSDDDERVTVKRALQKKIDDASDEEA